MKKNKNILIIITLLIGIITAYGITRIFTNKKEEPIINEVKKDKRMAIMIQNGDKYEKYVSEDDKWPGSGYVFNKAECVDYAGNRIDGAVTFDNETRRATVKSNKTIYCTLYFDEVDVSNQLKFYIKEEKKDKYTKDKENEVYLNADIEGEEFKEYCITEAEDSTSCDWKPTEGNKEIVGSYTFATEENGEKKVFAYIKNEYGYETKAQDTIIYDSESPTINEFTIKGTNGSNTGYSTSVNVTGLMNYMDNLSGVESYCINNSNEQNDCNEWKTATTDAAIVSTLEEGDGEGKVLYAYVKDKAGNISIVKQSNALILDTKAPSVDTFTITGSTGSNAGYSISLNVTGEATYNDALNPTYASGLDKYCISNSSNVASKCENWQEILGNSTAIEMNLNKGDGADKVLYAFVKDKAGNTSAVKQSNALALDTKAPTVATFTITGSTGSNAGYSISLNVTGEATYNDALNPTYASGLDKYCISNSSNDASKCENWQEILGNSTAIEMALKEGDGADKVLYAFVKDKAGNTSAVKQSNALALDTKAPTIATFTITGSSGSNSGYSKSTAATGKLEYSDSKNTTYASGVGKYCVSNSSSDASKCTTWNNVTTASISTTLASGDGTGKVVYAFVKDKAGNISEVKTSNALILDTKAPTIATFTITGSSGSNSGYSRTTAATGTMTYSDPQNTTYASGVDKYCVSNSSNDVSKCTTWNAATTASISTTLASGDGTGKVVYAFVKDKAGNTSSVKTSNALILDTKAPTIATFTITGSSGSNSGYSRTTAATGKLEYSDPKNTTYASGVDKYCVSNSSNDVSKCTTWNAATTASISTTLASGDGTGKVVYAFVKDKAGNTSSVKTSNALILDTKAPTLSANNLTLIGTSYNAIKWSLTTASDDKNNNYASGLDGNYYYGCGAIHHIKVGQQKKQVVQE